MSPRVLYIEDNAENRMLVRRILMVEGFEVLDADNAHDGIQMALENPPDIILMDISMPGYDGLSATQVLRQRPELDHVPIIAVTANVMKGDREQTLRAGCDGYIPKPIDVDQFPDLIRSFLDSNS
ncbi:MAG: response regulator [Phototrophicales bacterium]|nr:MAG: response regulator [Phototrophicales bacterium]